MAPEMRHVVPKRIHKRFDRMVEARCRADARRRRSHSAIRLQDQWGL